jgi:hypothetical protein
VTYVVRLDGATCDESDELPRFEFLVNAWIYAQLRSRDTWPGRILTVHDGDAVTEGNVVAVFYDGVQVGPAVS